MNICTHDHKTRSRNHTLYKDRYDMVEDATAGAVQAGEKLTAKSVEPGKYDLILDPSHLWLPFMNQPDIRQSWTACLL